MSARFVPRLLAQLRDVLISSPTDGDGIFYNSSSQKWENSAGGGGSQTIQASPGTLVTAAEILAVRSSTGLVTLVAAPGAGKVNVPVFASLQFTAGETPYIGVEAPECRFFVVPSAAWLDWSNPPWAVFKASEVLIFDGGADCFAATYAGTVHGSADGVGSPITDFENTEIVLAASGFEGIAEGDGTLFVTVLYWTIDLVGM